MTGRPSLGFTVPDLLGAARIGGGLKMGLSRVAEADWRQPVFDRAARAAAFDAHPERARGMPGSEAAGREVAALVGVAGGLADAARATWEDLCILQPDAEGRSVLTAAAVAFPTDWRLDEKMGRSLAAIHEPIHGYADQLSAGVDHFMRTLAPGPIYGRANWFVVPTDAWAWLPGDAPDARFAHVTPDNAGRTLFVRCERQTLRRLPGTGAILFTIGIAVAPLGSLDAALVHRLATSLSAGPAGEGDRRAAPLYADAMMRHARMRGALPAPLEAAA